MRLNFKKIFLLCIAMFCLSAQIFAQSESTTPVPYEENEFPMWAHELRRAEIITFGSMPFVSIGVTLGYGLFLYARQEIPSIPNPFSSRSSSFTADQTRNIVLMTAGISIGYGLTDFLINHIRRKNYDKKKALMEASMEKASVYQVTPEEAMELLENSMQKQKENEAEKLQSESEASADEGTSVDSEISSAEKEAGEQ